MLFYGLLFLIAMTIIRETLTANMRLFYWELQPSHLALWPLFTIASYFVSVTSVYSAIGDVVDEVNPLVLFELGIFEGVITAVPVLGAIYFCGKYKIDKNRHEEIRQAPAAKNTFSA